MRDEHVLKNTSGKTRPSRIVFVDTETIQTPIGDDKHEHTLRLGHAKFCRSRRGETLREQDNITFYNKEDFWQWLIAKTHKNEHTYMVAHNWNYDLPILKAFSTLLSKGYKLISRYTKGYVTILRWEKYYPSTPEHHQWLAYNSSSGKKPPSSKITAIDNANYFSGTLASWGDKLNLPKLPVDFDGEDDQLIEYCIRDVEIMRQLWLIWFKFLDDNKCGNWKHTVSATSFNTFRASFNTHQIHIHNSPDALEIEREAYKGGRVECFYKDYHDGDNFYLVDINSMYPFVMRQNRYPTGLFRTVQNPPIHFINTWLQKYCVTATVTLNTPLPYFPFKIDGNTAYPTGTFKTSLTTPELKLAISNGWVKQIHSAAKYKSHEIFTDFVDYFYNLRLSYDEKGEKLWSTLCKLILNSLYGKFGQLGLKERLIGFTDYDAFLEEIIISHETEKITRIQEVAGTVIEITNEGESYNSFPSIAAHVTAYARIYLYDLILKARRKNTYYCDTDSLIVNQTGFDNIQSLLHPTKLGMLKLEQESQWVIINAPKDYAMKNRIKTKGIKQNAKILSYGVYEQMQWPKLTGLTRDNSLDTYITGNVVKHLSRELKVGRVFQKSGLVVPPHLH